MIPTAERIRRDTTWLTQAWEPLYASRIKGTPRPWKEPTLTPEAKADLDRRAREERHAHGAMFGESPAPLHIDVLALTMDIAHTTRALATHIAKTIGDTPAHTYLTRRADHHPIDLLDYIHTTATQLDPEGTAAAYTLGQLQHLRTSTARYFTEAVDGQRLKTDCPWCGNPTLFFRRIGPEHRPEFVVACESGTCTPDYRDCGTWLGATPAWPFHEWTWLAKRINHHERIQAS